jgi:hypothetical protein
VRRHDGKYQCVLCGAVLDVPTGKEPVVANTTKTGSPGIRTITFDGNLIHSCPLNPTKN